MIQALASHILQSTLFACAVGLVTLLLRRNGAAVRHALWLTASVKFLVPFSLLITIGSQVHWRNAAAVVHPRVSSLIGEISRPFAMPGRPPLLTSEPSEPSRLPVILLGLWLCGFSANSLAWWRRSRRVGAALRSASPLALKLRNFDLPNGAIRVMSSPARLEPGVFGIRKPVLLLPEGIVSRLTSAQLQAILAHESCHVRRRDNLAAAIHMVVEALFWFHPLVWWIEARLIEERERACDEEVLRMTGDPQDYAEGILTVCKFYLESPLICVAGITSSNLRRRVEAIMMNRDTDKLNFGRKLLLTIAGVLAVAGPLVIGVLNAPPIRAQSSAAVSSQFEVASVKQFDRSLQPGTPDTSFVGKSGKPIHIVGNRITMRGTLRALIAAAYDIKDYQISAAPSWAGTLIFDVVAKTPGEAVLTQEQVRPMFQALLADRFQLNVRHEAKEVPVYYLMPSQKIIGLKPSAPGESFNWSLTQAPGSTVMRSKATKESIGDFVDLVGVSANRPVINKTGMTGDIDYDILISMPDGRNWSDINQAIVDAVKDQLGLKLEAARDVIDFLVVDHVQKPSAN
ncbi:MAG TPA: M56 family metallopeptidase [Bryobacteraceae bacterium]|nr:M56 family metallopeptidase [Bryobacteraceae bacterium]